MSSFAINTLTIDGNLVTDPELRTLPGGTRICKLRIAHNEQRKDSATGEYTDHAGFYDITVWAGPGEWVAANLAKSDRIVVNGRLTYREFEVDGRKRSQIGITAESIVPVKRTGATVEPPPADEPAKPARARRSHAKA